MGNRGRNKKTELRLTTKKHSLFSIVSFILALVSACLLIISIVYTAFYSKGTDGNVMLIGMLTIVGMLANISGTIFGIIGEFMVDDTRTFSHIGLIIHAILLLANINILTIGY
ncbi:MAG: DUF6142 family protein [Vallitaleaceae bacterium]|jgi:hypothetical protein|nr:DUF6142 family protein [Vallitaleaceae bacterium]